MHVKLFIPCFVDLFYPETGKAMYKILKRLGLDVEVIESPACCGQPAFNTGYWDDAKVAAGKLLMQMRGADAVVIGSGSCGAMVKVFYPELFMGTEFEPIAKEVSPVCFEFCSFLVDKLGVTDLGARFQHKVTYHDGCHSLREMHIKEAPRLLLAKVRDLEFIEMKETVCCGFGGTFSAKFPMISTAMDEVKCELAIQTGAEFVVSSDSSCLMQIQGIADRKKLPLKTIHLAEILNMQ
jgi:L-lactate dehydrogenase complex protein LldE